MRRGADRFDLGEAVTEALFPEGSGHLLGAALGSELSELVARFGEPGQGAQAAEFTFAVDDPLGNGRTVVVRVFHRGGRVHILDGRFYSGDRMDVDSAYREVRKRLEKLHGAPGKELTGVLKFVWQIGGVQPARTSVCRYKDDEGRNVLEVSTKLPDGVAMPGPQGPGRRLSGAKGPGGA